MNGDVSNGAASTTETTAKIIYVLYLASLFIGITGLIGVVMAYIYRTDAPDWLKSHYQLQIRTFWMGLLYLLLGVLLAAVAIGWLLILFWIVWIVVRCVKGLKALQDRNPYPAPETWLF